MGDIWDGPHLLTGHLPLSDHQRSPHRLYCYTSHRTVVYLDVFTVLYYTLPLHNIMHCIQRCKTVRTSEQCLCKIFPISGKILPKFYAVCRKSELCCNFALFGVIFGTFWKLTLLFWHFLHYLSLLGLLHCYANSLLL